MIKPARLALAIGAVFVATNIGPAQADPAADSLLLAASVKVEEPSLTDLIDPAGEPVLVDDTETSPLDPADVISSIEETTDEPVAVSRTAELADMVASLRSADPGTRELECLATGIYFESKSEPLSGQLAVGQVIQNRSASGGRFPSSYCGVLFQRGQFSFVRGKALPKANRASRQWHNAVAIAKIIDRDLKSSTVGKALFFHAKYVSPNWKLKRVAAIGNHIFYR